jgi:hypothetical protein
MEWSEPAPDSLTITRASSQRDRFGAPGALSDGHSSCGPRERFSPSPTLWIGWLCQRIAARRRQRADDCIAVPLGCRWCDATERRMLNELIGVHRQPFGR